MYLVEIKLFFNISTALKIVNVKPGKNQSISSQILQRDMFNLIWKFAIKLI